MTRKLVVATGNAGKLRELQSLLGTDWQLVSQAELGIEGAEETGATFRENAVLKARHAAAISGLAAIADDSGLEVDALDGAPGVHSARYAGDHGDDQANNRKLLAALKNVPDQRRSARFVCCMAYVESPGAEPLVVEGRWEGRIAAAARGTGGFGYDPVFVDPVAGRHSAEMEPDEKNRRSHRGQAAKALKDALQHLR